ncbi:MAG: 3-methylcrotonyl-CoA carboxylase [Thermomonas sp.]|uniref:acetyl/propionyl/methylcrotonyl-CoA carboxylase subunit alpha n=1 Tax=Thermomonas sp. TaxID=1971895 RepID=UPI002622B565|nr:biotin carboxylase N-terminal domain-containing protein [Thermomonas sp.]MCC7097641.1 3-methylcrotonyl-CoA carboxylase [Thermomonas sp.]
MFEKILIANRGEIACRVIRTARKLGVRTVAVFSEADADAQHARLADEAHPIGGPRPQDSYLRGDAIIAVAKASGAQAIHPGYGFLSENADFADAVTAAGLVFIGPPGHSMRKMGSKAGAKDLMAAAGVPVVPGYTGEDQHPEFLQREADRIGYPLMIKAAFGGGGKGMRIVRSRDEFIAHLESCQREAKNAFGRDRVLLERYIEHPRHIEFQIFADAHGHAIHLGERECSAQRRYQKVLEESPSPFLTPDLRARMGAAAVLAARAIDYRNAGTVEFIVGANGDFHFMEINTRLQVEHPVTEEVTGLDLVEWQLRVAAGEPLPLSQEQIVQRGHAIEVRLYAEDPDAGFLPGSGTLETLQLPLPSRQVRIESGVIEGDTVTIFYDPMIAKLVAWDEDRPRALARLREALVQCRVRGPKSNVAFLERLVRHPAIVGATIDTGYLDRHLEEFFAPVEDDPQLLLAAAVVVLLQQEADASAAVATDPSSPWSARDGWRLGAAAARRLDLEHDGKEVTLLATGSAGHYAITIGDASHAIDGARFSGGVASLRIDGQMRQFHAATSGPFVEVHDGRCRLRLHSSNGPRRDVGGNASDEHRIRAPMPGRVVLVKANSGAALNAGDVVLVLEAMKMELALKAPRDGVIADVRVQAGEFVEADAILATLEQ